MTPSTPSGSPSPGLGAGPWIRAAYVAFLATALLSPFAFRWEAALVLEELSGAFSVSLMPGDVVDGVRNLVLFAGWGLLWVITGGRGRPARERALRALATGAALSLSAELLQTGLPGRIPAVLDLLTNSAGAWAGAVAGLAAVRALERWRGRTTLLGVPLAAVAAAYLGAVLAEAAFPTLRHAGPPGSYGGPLTRAAWSLRELGWESLATLPLLDVLLFLPAGVLCALALRELQLHPRRALRWTAGLGIAVAVAGELVHAPLGRPMELGPVLVHVAAVAGGGWLGTEILAEPARTAPARERTRAFLAGYVALLVLWWARPFVPETDLAAVAGQFAPAHWRPLGALALQGSLYTVADVFLSFLLLVPVGAVLGVRPLARAGPLRALVPVLLLVLGLEVVQAFVAGRFFDVTDPIVAFAGAGVAWCLVREAGLERRGVLVEGAG